jgi:hypothetical protein
MTDKELIRMAEESGLLNPPQDGLDWSAPVPNSDYLQRIERFAALVAAAEREACNSLWEAQRLTDSQVSDHINAAIAAEREACAKIAEEHQHDCYYGGADWFEAKRIKAAIQERNKQ